MAPRVRPALDGDTPPTPWLRHILAVSFFSPFNSVSPFLFSEQKGVALLFSVESLQCEITQTSKTLEGSGWKPAKISEFVYSIRFHPRR
jgi:hypothetical protein